MIPQEGFRYWFTGPKGHTRQFYNDKAIWEEGVYEEPRYFTDAITGHAIDFLTQEHQGNLFSFSLVTNRHTEHYADKDLPSFPRQERLFNNRNLINSLVSIRGYASA